jgi:1-acyl-sn-glycerol-3-phosphate acyltransferase
MKIIKELLGRLFALWALLVFFGTLLLVVIPIWLIGFIAEPRKTVYSFKVFNAWLAVFFVLSGVRRRIVGTENFLPGETYVVVCNHRSLMDPPLSSPAIPAPNKTIAKSEMAKIPVFNIIYRRGSVLVDRKSEESRRASFFKMKEVLAMGLHMCIYPEGTRNKTREPLTRFHEGAFKLAVESGKAVIPALIFNTDKVMPRKTFFFWPCKVEMHFLPQVSSANKTARALKDEVFEIMKTYYLGHQ